MLAQLLSIHAVLVIGGVSYSVNGIVVVSGNKKALTLVRAFEYDQNEEMRLGCWHSSYQHAQS